MGHSLEGALVAPCPAPTWEAGPPGNMKICTHVWLANRLSVTRLEIDQTAFSNVDEPALSLGAETWRNMVGGGTISGLWSVMQKWNLEVLMGHMS